MSRKRSRFIDDEAGEAESDEDDSPKKGKDKKHREREKDGKGGGIFPQRQKLPSWLQGETTEEDIRRRYEHVRDDDDGDDDDDHDDDDDDDGDDDDDNLKNARLPDSAKDPKVWCVKVANGTERQVVLQLQRKFIVLGNQDHPIHITSAYCNEQLPGFIYVEAVREAFVKEALSGLLGVYHSTMKLVPVKEMVSTVKMLHKNLEGKWARCRRGKYKGDIAFILKHDADRNEVQVKLVPRVDQTDYSGDEETVTKKREEARKRNPPPKRPFEPSSYNKDELLRWGINSGRDPENRKSNAYFYEGFKFQGSFLTTSMPVKSVTVGPNVVLEPDELKIFAQGQLQKGDRVRVKAGQQIGLLGKVDSILGETVTIVPQPEAPKPEVFQLAELEKCCKVGDDTVVEDGELQKGDLVRVKQRPQIDLLGEVDSIRGERVTVVPQPGPEGFKQKVFQLEELEKCCKVGGSDDVKGVVRVLEDAQRLRKGDLVRVKPRRQMDRLGKVISIRGERVTILPQPETLKHKAEFSLDELGKYFELGDNVKVSAGCKVGATGTVVKIDGDKISVLTGLLPCYMKPEML